MNKSENEPITLSSLPASPEAKPAGKSPGEQINGPKGFTPRPGQVICGDLDIRIDRGGVWHYRGSPIGRKELVRLFATVLYRDEDGDYWLVTPAEVGRIEVEDAPLIAVELALSGSGSKQIITLRTNVDTFVTVDGDHPIRVDIDPETKQPSPYLVMDGGIEARLTRAVYYELVSLGTEKKPAGEKKPGSENHDGENHDTGVCFGVWSSGVFFALGTLEPER